MAKQVIEAVVGAVVLVSVAGISYFAIDKLPKLRQHDDSCYKIFASFQKVEGITAGSKIFISGVQVGTVDSVELNPRNYFVKIGMCLDKNLLIPEDSDAKIEWNDLVSPKYININPGADFDVPIKNGGTIKHTNSGISLSTIITKAIDSVINK